MMKSICHSYRTDFNGSQSEMVALRINKHSGVEGCSLNEFTNEIAGTFMRVKNILTLQLIELNYLHVACLYGVGT